MEYQLKASGILILLFLFYHIFLRKETFFNSIRGYFLIGLGIVLLFPIIEIPIYVETVAQQSYNIIYTDIENTSITPTNFDWNTFILTIYLIGVCIFAFKFIIQLVSLIYLLLTHKAKKVDRFYYIQTTKNVSPFSFFNIIIYNKNQFSIEELQLVINHEKAHALQWHSFDTILAHLLVITLWFNPFVWLYKKAVLQNLEFLADAYAFKNAENQKLYQITLLKTCSNTYCTQLTNNFYNSLIKKRIIMLHKNKSNNAQQWKYVLVVPILMAFVFTFNTKVIAQEKNSTKNVEVNITTVDLIIDKNTTKAELEAEKITFKEEFGISLSFKGIKRNDKNEITAIKISAKGKNSNAQFQNSGTTPIKPIKISFDSESNSIAIGNVSKHENHFVYKIHSDKDHHFKGKPNKDGNYVFVTSDNDGVKWTSKDGDTIIHKNKIVIKGNGDDEHIWISDKNNNKKITVEVIDIENGKKKVKIIDKNGENLSSEDIKVEILEDENVFIIDEDNASENVFVIKKDGKAPKIKKQSKNIMVFNDGDKKPLYIIDGKESTSEAMEKLDSNSIESINVLKGEAAEKKYGDKAKNGVIEIKTKSK